MLYPSPQYSMRPALIIPPEYPTLEHVVPLAFGGLDDLSNIVVACRKCNHSRSAAVSLILQSKQLVFTLRAEAGFSRKSRMLNYRAANTIEAFIETIQTLV